MVSVIIPTRSEPYLQKTVDDVLAKATGEIEVIVVMDGGEDAVVTSDPRVRIINHHTPRGTRRSLNEAIAAARGEYIFKLDAHCLLSPHYDEALLWGHHDPSWVTTLPRYSLDPEAWELGYGPICYEYIAYPLRPGRRVGGMTPKKWYGEKGDYKYHNKTNYYWMENARQDVDIDEIPTMNGACWFMRRQLYLDWGGLDEKLWNFHNDAVEIGMKAWLSGGALMINKHAYHGHWWKPSERRTVELKWDVMHNSQWWSTWYWTHDQWPLATRTFEWFVEHFWPIPGWPDNWREHVAALKEPQLIEAAP